MTNHTETVLQSYFLLPTKRVIQPPPAACLPSASRFPIPSISSKLMSNPKLTSHHFSISIPISESNPGSASPRPVFSSSADWPLQRQHLAPYFHWRYCRGEERLYVAAAAGRPAGVAGGRINVVVRLHAPIAALGHPVVGRSMRDRVAEADDEARSVDGAGNAATGP